MKIEIGIWANCSEASIVIYPDKLSPEQKEFVNRFLSKQNLNTKLTPKKNIAIELADYESETQYPRHKEDLWEIADDIELLSDWDNKALKLKREIHFDLMRDESYYDMIEEGTI